MKGLFEPVRMRNLTTKKPPRAICDVGGIAREDGSLPEEAFDIYAELARGGIGAIITGFTSVAANDRYFDGMMRLSDDSLTGQYARLVDIIHAEGCPVIAQLALGAFYRPTSCGYEQVEPDGMTQDEIHMVVGQFADAAARADGCGFDGVQIHVAHFFFLSRFISGDVNHRHDEYGGGVADRCRVLLEILAGIRDAAPGLHVGVKVNSSDFAVGGIDEDECLEICGLLDGAGIDSIEVSGNGTSVQGVKAHVSEGYFVSAATRVADAVSCPVIVVGGLRSRDVMKAVVSRTRIELVSLSRPLLREPALPKAMMADPACVSKCVSCNLCYSTPSHRCIFLGRA